MHKIIKFVPVWSAKGHHPSWDRWFSFNSSHLQQHSNLSNKLNEKSLTDLLYTVASVFSFIPFNNAVEKAIHLNLEGN